MMDFFQYAFILKQHERKFKGHAVQVPNIKQFVSLCNCNAIKYLVAMGINNCSCASFEWSNCQITLVVLYDSVDNKPFIEKGEVKVYLYKLIK